MEEFIFDMLNFLVLLGVLLDIFIKDFGGKILLMCVVLSFVLVKGLLNLGLNIYVVDEVGNIVLFYVVVEVMVEIEDEYFEFLKIFFEFNFNVNVKNEYGEILFLFDVFNGKKWFEGSNL